MDDGGGIREPDNPGLLIILVFGSILLEFGDGLGTDTILLLITLLFDDVVFCCDCGGGANGWDCCCCWGGACEICCCLLRRLAVGTGVICDCCCGVDVGGLTAMVGDGNAIAGISCVDADDAVGAIVRLPEFDC